MDKHAVQKLIDAKSERVVYDMYGMTAKVQCGKALY